MRYQQHHDKILEKFLPKLKKHLERNCIDSGLYTLKWFFQCFLDRVSPLLYALTHENYVQYHLFKVDCQEGNVHNRSRNYQVYQKSVDHNKSKSAFTPIQCLRICACAYVYLCLQVPFTLTLRLWDIFLLEGERLLVAFAYCILKLHRRQITRLDMDQILDYLQKK